MGVPESVTAAHAPTAAATTAIAGHIQRHDKPAWMTSAAVAAPINAPVLNRACSRTNFDGWSINRCEASAFIAVSMLPPAISVSTSTTTKAQRSRVRASTHSSAAQANSASHSSRRAPTRSARCAITALETPATAMAMASTTPSSASDNENACWMLKSITAQLPQKSPNVTNAAMTGPAPASGPPGPVPVPGPDPIDEVAEVLRACPSRPPGPGTWRGRSRPASHGPHRRVHPRRLPNEQPRR